MNHTCDMFSDTEWAAFWRQNEKSIMQTESIFKGTLRQHEWRDVHPITLEHMTAKAEAGAASIQILDGGVRRSNESFDLGDREPTGWMACGLRILAGDCWGPSPTWGIPPVLTAVP